MSSYYLSFEKPIEEIEKSIAELRESHSGNKDVDFSIEIDELEKKREYLIKTIYENLTPWQVTQVARHPERPTFSDYQKLLFDDFIELHGDRLFRDDPAIVTGFARIGTEKFVIVGEDKGKDTKEKIRRNFGMPNPEGYRKAMRIMRLAEKFKKPILTLIDTAGAYPGIEGEERGQAEAIARNLFEMSGLKTPVISVVIGEGGSGGALAIAVADRVLMLQNSIYSVISPESCASILWRDAGLAERAAESLKMTAPNLIKFKIIEEIIPEPFGGAHRDIAMTMKNVRSVVLKHLAELKRIPGSKLVQKRYERFRKLGAFEIVK
ncbi:MAG: acetyl-CoA carboxylase carboxyltransferase subunit alpha [Spirochaetes bacterium GWF1_49_6]|nr:MAG: acetyl-CoA carboxylase carboxyltransferase subunit alpha [Spirochaetes bacterium GWF1_49_6]